DCLLRIRETRYCYFRLAKLYPLSEYLWKGSSMSSILGTTVIDEKEFNTAIARAFAVLESFDATNVEMTLSQVAARTGLTPATARRCLYTLSILGYIRQHGRKFTLGARVLTLSSSYM